MSAEPAIHRLRRRVGALAGNGATADDDHRPSGPEEEPGAGGLTPHERRMVLLTCCSALFITTLDNTVANVALPSIGRDLETGARALQWVVAAYIVVRGCLLLSAGALGDRFGRRRLLRDGLLVFGIGSLLCSVAPTAGTLIGSRVIQALGGCFLVPSSLAVLADAYPGAAERARAIGIWSATTGFSMGLGPLVGGALVAGAGWRSVFWINLPVVAVAIGLTTRYVRESRSPTVRRLDLPGQALVFVVLVALTSGFIEASDGEWTSPRVLALFAVAVVALVAFLIVETHREDPLLEPSLFRSPAFSAAAAMALVAFVIYTGYLFVNTLYLQEVRGYSALAAGLLMVPATLGNVVLSPLSGHLTALRGPRLPVTLASLLMLAGALLLSRIGPATPLPTLLVGYVLIGSGIGLVNAPITNAAVAGLPRERGGVAGAVASTFRQVGSSLGVALLGTLTFAGFASALPGHIAGLGLSPATTAHLEATARHASGNGGLGTTIHRLGPHAGHAVAGAFTTGVQHAYLVAAGMALIGVIVGATAFGRRPRTAAMT